jgi:hypothetical protein
MNDEGRLFSRPFCLPESVRGYAAARQARKIETVPA